MNLSTHYIREAARIRAEFCAKRGLEPSRGCFVREAGLVSPKVIPKMHNLLNTCKVLGDINISPYNRRSP